MRTAFAVSLLLICLLGVVPASAQAACPRPPATQLLARSSQGIVWNTDFNIRGCLKKIGKSRVLTAAPNYGPAVARIAGPYAAAGISECDKIDGTCSVTTVVVTDLRSGRRTIRATYGDTQDRASAAVDDLSLSATGTLVELLHVADNREVWLLCPHARRRLAARAASELGSKLVRRQGTVWWTKPDGQPDEGVRPKCRS
jgi:hypothetical protein